MDKAGKHALRQELEGIFETAGAVVVTHYSGLSVADMTELRGKLRENGGQLKVIKNRVAVVALGDTGGEAAAALFKGPVAIAFAEDPTVPAKATAEFAKTNDNLKLVGAIMNGEVMDAAGVTALSKMASREEMIGSVVGRLMGQASEIGQRVGAPGQQLAGAISAIQEQAAA